jgi:hypothetical protein
MHMHEGHTLLKKCHLATGNSTQLNMGVAKADTESAGLELNNHFLKSQMLQSGETVKAKSQCQIKVVSIVQVT